MLDLYYDHTDVIDKIDTELFDHKERFGNKPSKVIVGRNLFEYLAANLPPTTLGKIEEDGLTFRGIPVEVDSELDKDILFRLVGKFDK